MDHKPIGQMSFSDAVKHARDAQTDLIQISANSKPPVCLLGDYGKYLYEHQKREAHHQVRKQKEIQLSATIFEHDLRIKAQHAKEFLEEGHTVKLVLSLRGREKAHPEIGKQKIDAFLSALALRNLPRISQQNGSFTAFLSPAFLSAQLSRAA